MTVKEFLKETYKPIGTMLKVRPRIVCADGFSISIQASVFNYCTPRENLENGEYTTVELGYPSEEDELIKEYKEIYSNKIYPYVPIEVVGILIEKHGGMMGIQ